VVMISELLEHREPRLFLAVAVVAFERNHLGRRMLAIHKCALKREIDKSLDQVAAPDRDLTQHKRNAGCGLQCRERLANALLGFVNLVQEKEPRNIELFELAQDQLQL